MSVKAIKRLEELLATRANATAAHCTPTPTPTPKPGY